jgi:hypothetical protein
VTDTLLKTAVTRFLDVRKKALAAGAQKPPATSELIDWVKVLHWQKQSAESLDAEPVPYWKVLFKTMQDLDLISRQSK